MLLMFNVLLNVGSEWITHGDHLHLTDDAVVPVVVGALGIGGGPGPVVGVEVARAGGALPQQLDAAALQAAHGVLVGTLAPPVGVLHGGAAEPLPNVI